MKLKIYQEALRAYSDSQIESAIGVALKSLRFFPKPVELIELIEGKKEEQSALAWEALLDTMQRIGVYRSVLLKTAEI